MVIIRQKWEEHLNKERENQVVSPQLEVEQEDASSTMAEAN